MTFTDFCSSFDSPCLYDWLQAKENPNLDNADDTVILSSSRFALVG